MQTFVIILAAGALSWGTDSLEYTRKYHELPKANTVCNVGVHSRYATAIGQHVHFLDFETGAVHGPFLVSDTAAPQDAGKMESNGLVADIDCEALVYKAGLLFIIGSEYDHPDPLRFDVGPNEGVPEVAPRVKDRLRLPHKLCATDPAIGCVKQLREWVNG